MQQATVDQAKAVLQLNARQQDELKVRAGLSGILQQVEVQEGQQVNPGANLVRVADPSRLKAEIKIAETQARDIQVGQRAEVDTRVGIVAGKVMRIDPSVQNGTRTVDVSLDGELPRGAVPDLSVDGNIELERLPTCSSWAGRHSARSRARSHSSRWMATAAARAACRSSSERAPSTRWKFSPA